LSPSTVRSRVASGTLVRLYDGVYAIGPGPVSQEGRWLAAVLACGPGAALSHRSAAALHGLQRGDGRFPDVTAPTSRGRSIVTISNHITSRPIDATTRSEIPVTSISQTLMDLAATSHPRFLESAIERAEMLRVLDARDLHARSRGRPGARALDDALRAFDPDNLRTREELERRVLALCRRSNLSKPQINAPLTLPSGPIVVDFLWPAHRLALEADSRKHHDTVTAFERDSRRDQALTLAGYRPIRTTWLQVTREPGELANTLRTLLA
jgi:very-short-patch-repair endonuclease